MPSHPPFKKRNPTNQSVVARFLFCFFAGFFFPLLSGFINSPKEKDLLVFSRMRTEMVERQIRARGIKDERVLQAMLKIPRHEFVPLAEKLLAYTDGPLPIGHGQTISQPYIVALMTELLELQPQDKVLEIGTGSGYQAAVLAEIAKEVYTIELLEPLYHEAKKRLEGRGYHNIYFKLGDGTKGWPDAAPFDKIMVTAAGLKIPEAFVQQLKEGGRLVIPLGEKEQVLMLGYKKGDRLETQEVTPVRFVPLVEEKLKGGEMHGQKNG